MHVAITMCVSLYNTHKLVLKDPHDEYRQPRTSPADNESRTMVLKDPPDEEQESYILHIKGFELSIYTRTRYMTSHEHYIYNKSPRAEEIGLKIFTTAKIPNKSPEFPVTFKQVLT